MQQLVNYYFVRVYTLDMGTFKSVQCIIIIIFMWVLLSIKSHLIVTSHFLFCKFISTLSFLNLYLLVTLNHVINIIPNDIHISICWYMSFLKLQMVKINDALLLNWAIICDWLKNTCLHLWGFHKRSIKYKFSIINRFLKLNILSFVIPLIWLLTTLAMSILYVIKHHQNKPFIYLPHTRLLDDL